MERICSRKSRFYFTFRYCRGERWAKTASSRGKSLTESPKSTVVVGAGVDRCYIDCQKGIVAASQLLQLHPGEMALVILVSRATLIARSHRPHTRNSIHSNSPPSRTRTLIFRTSTPSADNQLPTHRLRFSRQSQSQPSRWVREASFLEPLCASGLRSL